MASSLGENKKSSSTNAGRLRRELSKVRLDLMATKESMQSIIEEQEATNEELKSANEEIQSSNEELQSTNEEFRIRPYRTRESKIEGAVILLIDIDELRQALEVVLGMVHQPLLVLGIDLKVRCANRSFLETFGLNSEQTLGKFIYDLSDRQWDLPQLKTLLEDVLPRSKHVSDFALESHFPKVGFRKLRLNASRFFEGGSGMPLILLAIEEG